MPRGMLAPLQYAPQTLLRIPPGPKGPNPNLLLQRVVDIIRNIITSTSSHIHSHCVRHMLLLRYALSSDRVLTLRADVSQRPVIHVSVFLTSCVPKDLGRLLLGKMYLSV